MACNLEWAVGQPDGVSPNGSNQDHDLAWKMVQIQARILPGKWLKLRLEFRLEHGSNQGQNLAWKMAQTKTMIWPGKWLKPRPESGLEHGSNQGQNLVGKMAQTKAKIWPGLSWPRLVRGPAHGFPASGFTLDL